MAKKKESDSSGRSTSRRNAVIIAAVVVVLFAVLFAKGALGTKTAPSETAPAATTDAVTGSSPTSLTSVHNDATADYDAALKVGKPIYVLFHSLTCDPCIQISGVAEKVVPGYEGKVTFVNAITDDASAQQLASKFSFQYIPTSFFLKADGTVVDSYTGVLSEPEMKARLDKLVAK